MIVFLKILAVLALVFLNGFFVAAEFALVKIRQSRLVVLARQGKVRARAAQSVVQNLESYLSACQLGITLASLALGWLGEPLVSRQLAPLLRAFHITNPAVVTSVSVAVGFIIITFLHIVLGEQAPKFLAIRRVESTALWVSIPLRVFFWTLWPMIWLLNQASTFILRLMGIPRAEPEGVHSEGELVMILSEAARGGHITDREKRISERALRLADLKVKQIMVPRNEIVYFSLAEPLESNLARARQRNFARYPLCETDLDKVIGMVHLRDVFWLIQEGRQADLRAVAHEVMLVSEEESLEVVLERFQNGHIHLALVVDEVGAVSGLVTLENVLEQLVGPIQDEFDHEVPLIRPLREDAYEAAGRTPLTLLQRRLGVVFEDRGAVTLSGYFTAVLGRFPRVNDRLQAGEWTITVTRTDGLKVETARLEKK